MTSTLQNSNNEAPVTMSNVLQQINDTVMPAISLETADERWSSTLRNSLPGRAFEFTRSMVISKTAGLSKFGDCLQTISFALIVLMFLVIAAPQFANDKEGLALIIIASAGLRILGTLLNGKERYRPSAIDAVVLLFFGVNVVASFASHYLPESIHGLLKLFVYLVAYFVFVEGLQTKTKRRSMTIIASLLAGGLLVSLYGLWQFKNHVAPLATWEDPTVEDKATRIFSTLGNPNLLAGYLVPLIPLGIGASMIAWFAKGWQRWLLVPAFGTTAIITIATFLTGSRGGQLALIAEGTIFLLVIFAWAWGRFPRARLPLIGAMVVLPVVSLLIVHFGLPRYEQRFLSIFSGSEHSSNAYRINVWNSSLAMFKDSWWIGIGTGNQAFEQAYGLYMRSGFDALGTYCVPLEVAVETGIPGVLVFGWLLAALFARAHCRFWSSQDIFIRCLAIGCMTALVGVMVHGLFDTVFYRPQVQFIFWLIVSLIVALPAKEEA